MPVHICVPIAVHTVSGSWGGSGGSPLYTHANIDEGSTSPNDADYITCSSDNAAIFYGLTAMPSDFGTANSVTFRFRAINASKGTPRKFAQARLYQSDESTVITNAMDCTGTTTSWATLAASPTITGATSKAVWDAMRIRIQTNSGGAGTPFCSMVQVEVDYTEAAAGGVSSVQVDRHSSLRGVNRGILRGVNRIWVPRRPQILVPALILGG